MFLKELDEHLKLFGLGGVHALVNGVHDLRRLLDHGKGRADRGVCPALPDLLLRRSADPHAGHRHVGDEGHQSGGGLLVRQGHDGLTERHAASLDQSASAGRDAEDVGILTSAGVGQQEAGEVGVHARIQQLAPRCRDGVRSVTEDVQEANVVEAHARHEGVLHEVLTRLGELLGVLVIVADDGQDLFRADVDGHAVGDLKTALLALPPVLEADDVQLAIALVDLAVAVFGAHALLHNALLRVLLALNGVELRGVGLMQIDVLIDAKYL